MASEATAQQRSFAVHIPFTGIEMGTEDEVHVDVNLRNTANDDVDVKLEVERDPKADNWDVRFVSSQWGGFGAVSYTHLDVYKRQKNAINIWWQIHCWVCAKVC